MKLVVICASFLALTFSAAMAAALAKPAGPAILIIFKSDGSSRDFVYFSSFARCEAAVDKNSELVSEDKDAEDHARVHSTQWSAPFYRCISG